jgi:hypothetical protein
MFRRYTYVMFSWNTTLTDYYSPVRCTTRWNDHWSAPVYTQVSQADLVSHAECLNHFLTWISTILGSLFKIQKLFC